jgi:hypothetical protein
MSVVLNPEESKEVKMRKLVQSRQGSPVSPSVFGSSTDRFIPQPNLSPGVGRYNLEISGESNMIKTSPSLSKRGYVSSFVSKAPKLPVLEDKGVPGPCSYDIYQSSLSQTSDSLQHPSTMFIPSGNGRVPFPPPNNVPGPAAYSPNADPGHSPLLTCKPSATFLSETKRNSFLYVNDIPSAAKYKPYLVSVDRLSSPPRRARTANGDLALPPGSPVSRAVGSPIPIEDPRIPINGDVTFWKSTYLRFQDVGKDNKVPGPQRYFTDNMLEEYFPAKSLRSSGTYRGKYMGKLQAAKAKAPHTFGADLDRFKDSVYGRLDLIAQIPGPGTYFEDINSLSTIRATSPERTMSPVKSARHSENLTPHTYGSGKKKTNDKPVSLMFAKDLKKLPHSDYV